MTRLRKVISAALLATTAIILPAVSASGGTPSGGGHASCLPQGARTLAADRAAVAFTWHGSVYGCLGATGARQKLGSAGVCNLPPGRAAPVKLAGKLVAYGLERCGVDTGSSVIVVRNLATAKQLSELSAATLLLGPESYVSVASLVVRGNGAVGWIARDDSLVGHRPTTYEVHRFARGKASLLGSGTSVVPGSLRLAGSRMTWRDGGATRSAGLS